MSEEPNEDFVHTWDEPVDPKAFLEGATVIPNPQPDPEPDPDPDSKGKGSDSDDKDEDEDDNDFEHNFGDPPSDDDDESIEEPEDKKKKPAPKKKEKEEDNDSPVSFNDKKLLKFAEKLELDPEDLESSFEDAVDARVSEVLEELPQEARNLMKFVVAGGDISDFIGQTGTTGNTLTSLDPENEAHQAQIVLQSQLDRGESQEDAEAYVDFLKEGGKLEAMARSRHKAAVKAEAENKQKIVAQQEEARKAAREEHKKFKRSLQDNFKNVADVKITSRERPKLIAQITEYTEKGKDGQPMTPFYNKLSEIIAAGDEKTLTLAKLVMGDMDLSDVKSVGKTEQTKKTRENIRRTKSTEKRKSPMEILQSMK